jgi:hypothetical protein
MKTKMIICRRRQLLLTLITSTFILLSTLAYPQKSKEISLSVYPGFTLVNFEKALGYSDDYMVDWDQFYLSTAFRGFLNTGKAFHLGAEVAWEKLYYAYYVIPYGSDHAYREFSVSTYSIMMLGRFYSHGFFIVSGIGAHFFDSGTAASLCFETGYSIKAGSRLKFPISFRVNPILGDGTPTPVSIGMGVSYTIK